VALSGPSLLLILTIHRQDALNLRYENVTDFAYRFFPDSTIINNPKNPVGYYSAYLDAPTSFEINYRRNAV